MSLALRYSQASRDLLIITSNRDTYASWLKQTQIERAPLIMIIKNRTRVIIQWVFCVCIVQMLLVMNMKFIIWSISTVPIKVFPPIIFITHFRQLKKNGKQSLDKY